MRICVVCGARVRNHNPKVTTCDPVCTAARNAGRTRTEQHAEDMRRLYQELTNRPVRSTVFSNDE